MRVFHIGKYFAPFAGGIENFLHDLAAACATLGLQQTLLVHHHQRGRATLEEPFGPPRGQPYRVVRVRSYGQWLYAPVSPGFGRRLAHEVRTQRPDLIVAHMPNTSAFWLLTCPACRHIPWVLHWHADVLGPNVSGPLRLAYQGYRQLERALLSRAAAVVATSPSYLATSEPLRRWQRKARVIPLGLDPARVKSVAEPAKMKIWPSSQDLRLLSVGRFAPYKGYPHLIEAVARTPGVALILAGGGSPDPVIARRVRARDLKGRVRILGGATDLERNWLLQHCDLLCLPSTNRNEAFGLVLLEAMALAKPALVTRVPGSGMSWVVENGKTGWHVNPGDPGMLADRLAWIRDHPDALQACAANARARFEERFDIAAVARRSVRLYEDVLSR